MTAVIRFADASLAACTMRNSSIRLRSTGGAPVCTRKTSAPRIDSPNRQYVSSFANVSSSISPSSTPSWSTMRFASPGCDRPANTISRFCGPRSMKWPGRGSATAGVTSRPGSGARSVSITTGESFLVDLAGAGDGECLRRDVFRDDGARRNPSIVANRDRSNEPIVDPGPDVAPDRRACLRPSRLVREVGRDVPGRDVRAGADLGVADVREVGHLCALADVRVLHLHERARLRPRLEDCAGAKVTKGSDDRTPADLGIDEHRVRADLSYPGNPGRATQDRERVDDGVGRERSEEHTSELQSHSDLVCRLLLEKKKKNCYNIFIIKIKKKNNITLT